MVMETTLSRKERLWYSKKKLKATWLEPPTPLMPRVFLSEIDIEAFEDERIGYRSESDIVEKEEKEKARSWRMIFGAKRDAFSLENVSKDEYEYIAEKSEYAAWLLINGPEFVNHFALAMHRCRRRRSLHPMRCREK